MSHRNREHSEEIDRAVMIARRAASTGPFKDPARLTRLLYQRWFLGRTAPNALSGPASSLPAQRSPSTPRSQPWRAWGPLWTEHRAQGRAHGEELVRFHLSCAPRTTLHALALVSCRAESWEHPWLLTSRALNHQPGHPPGQTLPSPDATVLYVPVASLEELQEPIRDMLGELQPFLATTVPSLTLRVGRGVTLAQNPKDGRSYGEHRCSLIAGAVLDTLHAGHHSGVSRTLRTFVDNEIDPQRPYRSLHADWEWRVRGRRRAAA